jgi:cytochrome c-type biogenesis protein CcmE
MAQSPTQISPGGRRMLLLGAAVATLGLVVTLNLRGLEKNLIYYLDASELQARGMAAQGTPVRLGGLVQKQSVQWDAKAMSLTFRVGLADQGEPSVLVQATGAPPQMFQEGIGAVVEGAYDGRVFHADRVMVKHSNEYRPPAAGEKPADVMGTLEARIGDDAPAGNQAPNARPRVSAPSGQGQPAATKYE